MYNYEKWKIMGIYTGHRFTSNKCYFSISRIMLSYLLSYVTLILLYKSMQFHASGICLMLTCSSSQQLVISLKCEGQSSSRENSVDELLFITGDVSFSNLIPWKWKKMNLKNYLPNVGGIEINEWQWIMA